MARPKKDRELRHKHQIMLRLTDTEYEIVSENAKATHLPTAVQIPHERRSHSASGGVIIPQ